jgi:HPt (histidine-containing phosphotransfer) domain-containing protein
MPEHSVPDTNAAAERQGAAPPPLDTVGLLEQCMGNAALVAMLFDKFEKQAKDDLVQIEQALTAKDAGLTSKVAHALKGAAGALSANDVQRTAAAIELAARENNLEAAAQYLNDLSIEVERCLAYLPTARIAAKGAAATPKP